MTENHNFNHIEITKNINFYASDKRKIKKDPKTLRLEQSINNKPLVVILSWILAERKHLLKFAKFYIDRDFDVVIEHIDIWQLIYPTMGSQKVASDLVKFLVNNEKYSKILLHGFSIGGYCWSESLVFMEKNLPKYQSVIGRIVGQIWDSAADIGNITNGLPKAMFSKSKRLEESFRKFMIYYLEIFDESATQHYHRGSQTAFNSCVRSPVLMFVSKNDLIGDELSIHRFATNWQSNGLHVTWKCFDDSPHVGHFFKHREEYSKCLDDHLKLIGLMEESKPLKAKI